MGLPASDIEVAAETKKVLIVDDEQGIIKFLKKALELSGYEVLTANAADKALEVVMQEPIDLILTDIKMPGGSGFDLMSLATMSEKGIPIVLMSGHVDKKTMTQKGAEEGVVECLNKPFTVKQLRETISSALKAQDVIDG